MIGKSQRQIARDLGVDEGTIRRDRQKLMLPEPARAAIESGAAAEPHLRAGRRAAAAEEIRHRLALEERNGTLSRNLAKVLLDYLQWKPLVRVDEERILEAVDRELWHLGDQLVTPRRNPAKVLARFEGEKLPTYTPGLMEHLIAVLVKAMPQIAPERTIRTAALEKAIKAVQSPERRPAPRRPWGSILYA